MKKLIMIIGLVALTGCASEEQKLLDADNAYAVTQERAFNYVSLPACPEAAPACHDPATKAEIKSTVAANSGATGNEAVSAADEALTKVLTDHNINCRAGASCP